MINSLKTGFISERRDQSDSRSPVVRGDDGKGHVENELLVVNAVEQPITLTSLTVVDRSAKELTRIDGPNSKQVRSVYPLYSGIQIFP